MTHELGHRRFPVWDDYADYADCADYSGSVLKGIIIRELGITFLTNRYEGNPAGSKWRISSLATKKWGVSHFDLGFKSK